MLNYSIIAGVAAGAILLIVWLVMRNLKDREEFEQQMKDDYKKPKDEEDEM